MPQQQKISTENNFIAGLRTDFTALNFPENAATDTFDCVYDFEGDVTRRFGFDPEINYDTLTIANADIGAVMHYRWLNAGGDGNTEIDVVQIGTTLHFYKASDATIADPLSTTILVDTVDLLPFVPVGAVATDTGCQFAHGNGFLFVFSDAINPFYCTYDSGGGITATQIDVKIRDFKGLDDNLDIMDRPLTLSDLHKYNLENQGWANKPYWSATVVDGSDPGVGYDPQSFTGNGHRGFGPTVGVDHTWNIGTTLAQEGEVLEFTYSVMINAYDIDAVEWFNITEHGNGRAVVTSVSGSTITAKVTYVNPYIYAPNWELDFPISPITYNIKVAASETAIETFKNEVGVYPSNTDVWFLYKEVERIDTPTGDVAAEKFAPGHTVGIVQQPISRAPQGHFILDAFNLDRTSASDVTGLTTFTTEKRPRTGAWFQGRVWFAGIDASHDAEAELPFYTWTENIYFSQIIEDNGGEQFGKCYQFDDPTDENNFNLLPTDGGVITIQGAGSIYKLFSMQNGLLVFAANGIWFITGSSGIGFNAADYTITKISSVRSISGTSYVDVNGVPFFWNEEAIYAVQPAQQGSGLIVDPITAHSISRFYEDIDYASKKVAKGSYDPINYVVQWLYHARSNDPTAYEFQTDYIFDFFDISCHSVRSTDNGVTWVEGMTPDAFAGPGGAVNTGFHDWGNCAMPVTDGENNGLMVAVDLSQDSNMGNGATSGAHYGNRFLGISETGGGYDTWDMIEPWTSDVAMAPIDLAVSSTQSIIMTLPSISFFQPAYHAPAISYDLGSTWENLNITPAAASTHWARAAFSKDCEYMYLIGSDTVATHLYVSTDLGQNWTQLTNFGVYADKEITITDINASRLRCSADGRVILYTDLANNLSYSTDWGDTWTIRSAFTEESADIIAYFDPDPPPAPGDFSFPIVNYVSDAGVSANGDAMIVLWTNGYTYPLRNQLFLSTDEGSTWTNISPDEIYTDWEGDNIIWDTCNISPDGQVILVGLDYDNENTDLPAGTIKSGAYVSFDQGQTWELKSFTMDSPRANGSDAGNFTDAYVSQTFSALNSAGNTYNRALNYNTLTKAWYPWTITSGDGEPSVYDIKYVQNPGGIGAPDGIFKYVTSIPSGSNSLFTFAECSDTSYLDWDFDDTGTNYESYFLTGFKLHGQAIRKWQPEYIQMYSRNEVDSKYHIQGVFNFSTDPTSGRWSNKQRITIADKTKYGMWTNKIKIRGSGLVTQIRVSSIDDNPFDIVGWSIMENQNPNV